MQSVKNIFGSLGSLTPWDGTQRLETWMINTCGSEDCEYVRWVSKTTMLQAVNRAYNPGCIARYTPIWEGPENRGKSTGIAVLGGQWGTTFKVSLESSDSKVAKFV